MTRLPATTVPEIRGHNMKSRLSWQVDNSRCQVAATACLSGWLPVRVEARAPSHGVTVDGIVSIRLANVLLYLENKEALDSVVLAVKRAVEVQSRAFGPELPARPTEPLSA